MHATHLECTECAFRGSTAELATLCPECAAPLVVRYDLDRISSSVDRDALASRAADMWRFREVLPLPDPERAVSLGEGGTPLLHLKRLGQQLGLAHLHLKDEGQNPTGSFKARGMSAAVSMARELGATALAAPSAGNAGGALAAYGARAGLPVQLAMPADVPVTNRIEAELCAAQVELIDGDISDCGRWIAERAGEAGWFQLSTLKEPYRVEGKKTMGYELAMDLNWELPDVILYPTGGGTGLVGMAKAFEEMRTLAWLAPDSTRPRFVAVQAQGCSPVVNAFHAGADRCEAIEEPQTVASGLRVPSAVGDRWMLRILRECGGSAITVSDEELMQGTRRLATSEGIFAAPEAGALVPALEKLIACGFVGAADRVVLLDTGAGMKYTDLFGD